MKNCRVRKTKGATWKALMRQRRPKIQRETSWMTKIDWLTNRIALKQREQSSIHPQQASWRSRMKSSRVVCNAREMMRRDETSDWKVQKDANWQETLRKRAWVEGRRGVRCLLED